MILTFDKISKSYGKNKALTEFTAEFSEGVHALLGPNGSGKSTLMNILTDNLKADSGSICFNGENVLKWVRGSERRSDLCRSTRDCTAVLPRKAFYGI